MRRHHELYKRTRSCEVTCLSFGANRKEDYPDHFFCDGCELVENAVIHSMKRRFPNRDTKRYRCTGGHKDLAYPTTLKKPYRPPAGNKVETETTSVDTMLRVTKDVQQGCNFDDLGNLFPESIHDTGITTPAPGRDLFSCDPRRLFTLSTDSSSVAVLPGYTPEAVVGAGLDNAAAASSIPLTCMTASSISTGYSSTTFEELELQISLLRRRCLELEQKNASLEKTVQQLTMQIAAQLRAAQRKAGPEEATRQNHKADKDDLIAVALQPDRNNDDKSTAAAAQKLRRKHERLRLAAENAQLTHNFSIIIGDFISRGDLANRRNFPESRLAKIIVDCVTAFEWTNSEVLRFARQHQRRSIITTNGECYDTTQQLTSELLAILNRKRQGRHRGDKSKAALLVNCMWDDCFLHGEAKACMIDQVRQYLRRHVFAPWKILKAMDIAGFKLSLAGIEVLRHVENSSKYGRGTLPSKSTILRSARKLEAAALSICPFTMIGRTFQDESQHHDEELEDNIVGEGFEFDAVKVTETLFRAFGLMDEAKRRPVELGLASDGAQLTNTVSHVAAGLKFNDVAMRDPFTKQHMLLHSPDSLVQSRNLCFPLRIVIAKDSKKTLEGFCSLYKSFNAGDVAEALECRPFKMSFPGDMKLQWGALDEGGAAKVKERFCYICPCRSSTIHVPQDKTKCLLCIEKAEGGRDGEAQDDEDCYHYPFFADPGVRATLNEELDVLTSLLERDDGSTFDRREDNEARVATGKGRMYVRRQGELMVDGDLLDIDFRPNTTRDKAVWAAHIAAELSDRALSISGILSERQQRLREVLLKEQRARDLSHMLKESQPKERAMYLVLQAVVCILHLENRVGLKSIESILRSGLSNAQKGVLDWTTGGAQHRQDQYVERISQIIGTKILGTVVAPAQWRFPLSEDKTMGTLSMDNNRTRSIMNSIELLVEESFPSSPDVNRLRLLRCFPKYRAAMVLLRKDTDLDEVEIRTFQGLIDGWFNDWVKVYGKEGCTNYTHMLSSSHVMRYMQEWKCLHRFSQQGWEALNALIKSYFFRRTNRGGLSKNGTKKSKLLGIARWLQRRIMWYSGQGDSLFLDNDADVVDQNENDSAGSGGKDDDYDDSKSTTSDDDISSSTGQEEDDLSSDDDNDDLSIGTAKSYNN
jgi:hypothetical protein